MAGSLISTGLLKIISNRHAENAKRPGQPSFPDFQCHFHEHEGRLDFWTSPRSQCARKKDQWISAGIRIVTTSCADRPASSPLRKAVSAILGNLGDCAGIAKDC
jgi:hypothetical protein